VEEGEAGEGGVCGTNCVKEEESGVCASKCNNDNHYGNNSVGVCEEKICKERSVVVSGEEDKVCGSGACYAKELKEGDTPSCVEKCTD
jgi:hypothetical protein